MKSLCAVATILFILVSAGGRSLAADNPMQLTFLNSMQRIGLNDEPSGQNEVQIQAARNEVESFQIIVTAGEQSLYVTRVQLDDLKGPTGAKIPSGNIKLHRAEYVHVRRPTYRADFAPGLFADPLVPLINPITGETIEPRHSVYKDVKRWGESRVTVGHEMHGLPYEVFHGQNLSLWGDVRVPKDVPPGTYKGRCKVTARGGISAEIPITLTVWGFTLPDGPTHKSHFGEFSRIAQQFDIERNSERFREIEMRYCKALAEHRLNPPVPRHLLPRVNGDGSLTVIPERHQLLKKFMDELHVTDFEIPRSPFGRLPRSTLKPDYKTIPAAEREKAVRYYREFYDYLKANGWHERAYVYMLDEPNLRENCEQVLVLGGLVKQAAPQLKRLVVEQPFPQDPTWPDIDPAVDIWCPQWAMINRQSILDKLAHGDEVWSYTALVQRTKPYSINYEETKDYDPPYWHIDRPLTMYRVPTWINYRYQITGLLYWTTVSRVADPWHNPAMIHSNGWHYNGGGYLLYPGVPCGIDGPVACMRLKNIRDGMEDYEYFAILEKHAGRRAVDEIVGTIAPHWWDFAKSPDRFLAARRKIAEEILKHQP